MPALNAVVTTASSGPAAITASTQAGWASDSAAAMKHVPTRAPPGAGGERRLDPARGRDPAGGDHRQGDGAEHRRRAAGSAPAPRAACARPTPRPWRSRRRSPAASAARASSTVSTCQPQTAPPSWTRRDERRIGVREEEVDVRRARRGELERSPVDQRHDEVDAERGGPRRRGRRAPARAPPGAATSAGTCRARPPRATASGRRRDGVYDAETARRAAAPRVAAASRSTCSTSPAIAGHENRSAAARAAAAPRRSRSSASPSASASASASASRSSTGDEPARLAVVHDPRRALRGGGDRRQPARHRLDQHLSEALAARREREHVGGAEQLGQRLLRAPAREPDAVGAEPLDGRRADARPRTPPDGRRRG